jgi:hypothetical protein
MTTESKKPKQVGRKLKADPCKHRLAINLNEADYARFLAMYDKTAWTDKAKFLKAILFGKEIKYVKLDKAAMDYYMRLTTFHSQFRAVGVNYNQLVKALKATFTEKQALAFLYRLEKATKELVAINQKVINLTAEFEHKYLNAE